jgi:tape measure domain-containing protein
MSLVGQIYAAIGADLSGLDRGLSEAQSAVTGAQQQMERGIAKTGVNIGQLGAQFAIAGGAATAGLTLPLVGLAKTGLEAAAQMESAEVGFTSMLGSAEAAGTFLKDLGDFAAKTPFEFAELTGTAQRMMAMKFAAEDIIPALTDIGDMASAMGGNVTERVDGIVTALGQMQLKGKASAEELMQLNERGVPALDYLARAAGKTTGEMSELVSKGAVPAKEAVLAIREGMREDFGGNMSRSMSTLTGIMSNLGDEVNKVWVEIGKSLAPTIKAAAPVITQLFGYVKEGLQWFQGLPAPIKNAVLAIGAVAAAAGPVLVAIGAVLALPITGTMVAWAAAIAGAAAALAGIGTWIASNWEPIKAVMLQAWDGVSEAWTWYWGNMQKGMEQLWGLITGAFEILWWPFKQALDTLWDTTGTTWGAVWENISGLLSTIWNGIMGVATTAWNAVVGVFSQLTDWIGKHVPGMQKLLTLNEAWEKGLKEQEKAQEAANKAQEEASKKVKTHTTSQSGLAEAITAGTKTTGKLTDEQKRAAKQAEFYNEKIRTMTGDQKSLDQAFRTATTATMPAFIAKIREGAAAWDEQTKAIRAMQTATRDYSAATVPQFVAETKKVEDAFEALGMTSTREFAKATEQAQAAYEALVASGQATQYQQDSAFLKVLQAMADESEATTGQIPKDLEAALREMDARVNDPSFGVPKLQKSFADTLKFIGDGMSALGNDAIHALIHGDIDSLKEIGGAFKQLGLDALSTFAQPFIDSITGPNGLIQKGINVLIDKVLDLDGILGRVFGSAASGAANAGTSIGGAVGSMPGIGGAAGGASSGAGGAASGAGSAAAGALGIVNAITGIATAISSIFGNFQMAAMNRTLDMIEENTRYVKIVSAEGEWSILRNTGFAREYLGYLVEDMRGNGNSVKSWLSDIQGNTYWSLKKLEEMASGSNGIVYWQQQTVIRLNQMLLQAGTLHETTVQAIRSLRPGNLTVNIHMGDQTQTIVTALSNAVAYAAP